MDEIALHLQQYVEKSYFGLGAPRATGLTNISSGWESDVYTFQLEFGPESSRRHQDLVLRIYPGDSGDEKAKDEHRTLALLHQMEYPVPEVFRLETDHAWFGRPFIIMERIEGGTLWPMIFEQRGEQQAEMLALYCRLMLQLHRLDWRPYLPEEARKPDDPYQYARDELERGSWYAKKFGFLTSGPIIDWLHAHLSEVPCPRASFVHWDFHPRNIMIRPDGSPLVIDWTSATISDARFDLAWSLMIIEAYAGLEWRERVQAEYERQAGAPLTGMDFFNAYACLRRLFSVMISMKAGAGALGMRPGAEQIMKNQREPLKRVAARLKMASGIDLVDIDQLLDS